MALNSSIAALIVAASNSILPIFGYEGKNELFWGFFLGFAVSILSLLASIIFVVIDFQADKNHSVKKLQSK